MAWFRVAVIRACMGELMKKSESAPQRRSDDLDRVYAMLIDGVVRFHEDRGNARAAVVFFRSAVW